jgi:hypothetical protein
MNMNMSIKTISPSDEPQNKVIFLKMASTILNKFGSFLVALSQNEAAWAVTFGK